MQNLSQTDVLIIGAGPAGCLAAAPFLREGFTVRIVEKEKFPRFVIGESLLPRIMDHLSEAGYLEAVKAANFQQKFGAKFVREDSVCDFNFQDQFSQGWNWTWQVPRAEFDQILARSAQEKGAQLTFEASVQNIEFQGTDSQTLVKLPTGETEIIKARFLVDASGYGRVMPKLFNLDKPSQFEPRKAHFTHLKDPRRDSEHEGNRITVVIHEPRTWIWIIPFSNGFTSVGYVADPEFFKNMPEDPVLRMNHLINKDKNIRDRFKNSEMNFVPKTIEGYAISTHKLFGPGFALCGNATEFLDPIFSSGVTFAMESGTRAAKLGCQFLKGQEVDWQKDYTDYMMSGINTFRSYVTAWYTGELHQIFFAKNPDLQIKKQICSVLAGYVWDQTNSFVANHERIIKPLANLIRMRELADLSTAP